MVESLGITEAAMNMPIRSSMEVVQVGDVRTGAVFIWTVIVRKRQECWLSTVSNCTPAFAGPIQSGLTKMMVVGMGKIRSASVSFCQPLR